MRVQKSHSVYKEQKLVYPRFVEPNQAFTPRQIIDQFSRGEISAKSFEETDIIYDDVYSDDQMVDHTIEFEDQFEAVEFMQTTKVIKSKPNKSKPNKEESNKKEDDPSVKTNAEVGENKDGKGTPGKAD